MRTALFLSALLLLASPASAEQPHVVGSIVELKCAEGFVGVSVYWSDDPKQAGIRYIRDPGNVSRCMPVEMSVMLPVGKKVMLQARGDELYVVGPAPTQPN